MGSTFYWVVTQRMLFAPSLSCHLLNTHLSLMRGPRRLSFKIADIYSANIICCILSTNSMDIVSFETHYNYWEKKNTLRSEWHLWRHNTCRAWVMVKEIFYPPGIHSGYKILIASQVQGKMHVSGLGEGGVGAEGVLKFQWYQSCWHLD